MVRHLHGERWHWIIRYGPNRIAGTADRESAKRSIRRGEQISKERGPHSGLRLYQSKREHRR